MNTWTRIVPASECVQSACRNATTGCRDICDLKKPGGSGFAIAESAAPSAPEQPADTPNIKRAARAMALHSGWSGWDTATNCSHTPNGNEPDEEREYWLELAKIAIDAAIVAQQGKP